MMLALLTSCGNPKVEKSSSEYVGMDHLKVEKEFQDLGYKNITVEELADLSSSEQSKEGSIESISINGESFEAGNSFKKNSEIHIVYHTIKTIPLPLDSEDVKDMNFADIGELFASNGYTNVEVSELHDLDPDTTDVDHINEVTVSESSDFHKGDSVPFDAAIVVNCHYPYEKCNVDMKVDFLSNLFFDKYGVEFYLDDEKIADLAHGEDWNKELRLKVDTHTITFQSNENPSVKGEAEFDVTCNTEIEYDISCYSDYISINTDHIYKESDVGENQIRIAWNYYSFSGEDYRDVTRKLKAAGFSNISEQPVYDIYFGITREGSVAQVSIDGSTDFKSGDIFDKDAEIVVSYHLKEEDDPSKPIEEPVQSKKEDNISKKEDNTPKKEAPATSKEVYENVHSPQSETKAEENNQVSQEKEPDTEESSIPVMTGSSLEAVMAKAEEFGFSKAFDDEDFGHGTKLRQLHNPNDSIELDFVYYTSTKEIMMGTVVTFATATKEEQLSFIKAISGVLCPTESIEDVNSWINSNLGQAAETMIDGVDYELAFGEVDNALYYAGEKRWGDWDNSFY